MEAEPIREVLHQVFLHSFSSIFICSSSMLSYLAWSSPPHVGAFFFFLGVQWQGRCPQWTLLGGILLHRTFQTYVLCREENESVSHLLSVISPPAYCPTS